METPPAPRVPKQLRAAILVAALGYAGCPGDRLATAAPPKSRVADPANVTAERTPVAPSTTSACSPACVGNRPTMPMSPWLLTLGNGSNVKKTVLGPDEALVAATTRRPLSCGGDCAIRDDADNNAANEDDLCMVAFGAGVPWQSSDDLRADSSVALCKGRTFPSSSRG
jgi:hypothetical protein